MPPALFKLMRFQARAVWRRMFRGARTPRGATFLVVGIIIFFSWFASTMTSAFLLPRADPHTVRIFFPPAMLMFCVMTLVTNAGERAVAFTPAEVDFLFPGPFSRRQLLAYKIFRSAYGALFTALIFSFVFLRYAQHWLGGWIAVFLGLIFVQLLAMAVVLIGQTLGEQAFTRARKLAMFACIIAAAAIVVPRMLSNTPHSLPEVANHLAHSTSGRIVLAPFRVFGQILTADPVASDAFKWAGIAIVQIIVLLAIVFRLDTHYLEAAAKSGQQYYDRIQRFRRGGGMAFRASSSKLRLPSFPRLGGAGPIAWRQLTTTLRTARALLLTLLFICLAAGPAFYYFGAARARGRALIGVSFWLTFTLANLLRFDFRGDLDQIDALKALPIPPWRIAAAQLIAPVCMLVLFQITLIGSIGVMLHMDREILALALLFAIPMNAMLIAVENLIFFSSPFAPSLSAPAICKALAGRCWSSCSREWRCWSR